MGVVVGAELSFQRRAGILQPLWPWTHPPCAAVSPNLRGTMMLPMGRSRESQSSQKPWSTPSSQGSRLLLSLWTPQASAHHPLGFSPSPLRLRGPPLCSPEFKPGRGRVYLLVVLFLPPGAAPGPSLDLLSLDPGPSGCPGGKQGSPPPPFPHSGLDSKSLTQPLTK